MKLADRDCKVIVNEKALTTPQANTLLAELNNAWQIDSSGQSMTFDFTFKNFHETMAFVNALAWIAHQQDHHPDLEVGYKHCLVRYSTHSIGGLSDNDFICAAKIEQLLNKVRD